MKLYRLIYFAYYLKQLDLNKFSSFLDYAAKLRGRSKLRLLGDLFIASFKYNISILEYFQFGFYENNSIEFRQKWAGTGYMYEYQKVMNPPSSRDILDDKRLFYKNYQTYFKHHVVTLEELKKDKQVAMKILSGRQLVLKESKGKCGLGTAFFECTDFTAESLYNYMEKHGYDLAESYIKQHSKLNILSPSGVNTVRIFTQLTNNNEVEILGCRQRISVNSPVDNLAAGNLAAPIDQASGMIKGPGIYSDITKPPEEKHPVTGVSIVGFQVPMWKECIDLAIKASKDHPQNRSIGWDIVVTEDGPSLIEGNHDWCKLVWQLPIQKGLKSILDKHLTEYNSRYV